MATVKDGPNLMRTPGGETRLVTVYSVAEGGDYQKVDTGEGPDWALGAILAQGCTFTPLLLATPERIEALEFAIEMLDYEASWRLSNDSKFPNAKLVDEGNVLRQMLAEMKGEAHHATD